MRLERVVRCLGAVIAIAVIVGDGPDGHLAESKRLDLARGRSLGESLRRDLARRPLRRRKFGSIGGAAACGDEETGVQRSGPLTGGGGASDTLRVRVHGRQERIRERARLIGSHLPARVLVLRIGRIGDRHGERLAHDMKLSALDANRRDQLGVHGQSSACASRSRPIGGRCCWGEGSRAKRRRNRANRPGGSRRVRSSGHMAPSTPEQPVMAAASLFSAEERTRLDPRRHSESEYQFLDRSARGPVASIRVVLDEWYQHLPVAARASIRNRFGSDDLGHHRGALMELYLHEAARRLGFEIEIDVGREDSSHRRPDFLLAARGPAFHLEATAVLGASVVGDQASAARTAALREAVERIEAPAWFVGLDVQAVGDKTPGRRDVTEPVQRWLDGLDPDAVSALATAGERVPRLILSFDAWRVECGAYPVGADHRGAPDHRVLGSYTEGVDALDDVTPLRRKLKTKARRYGPLELPFVVAVLCAGDFADDRDIADALFGSTMLRIDPATGQAQTIRNTDEAFWLGPDGPMNTGVSAVVTVPQLSASAITAVQPTLWLNPWAARPLTTDLPWRTMSIGGDGTVRTREATRSAAELFDLPERWPQS